MLYYRVMNKILVATTAILFTAVMGLGTIALPAMATGVTPPEPPTDPAPDDACDGLEEALAQAEANGDAAAVAAIEAAKRSAGC